MKFRIKNNKVYIDFSCKKTEIFKYQLNDITIFSIVKRFKERRNHKIRPMGDNCPMLYGGRPPKVTPAIRQKIMKDFESGLSILDVATRYKISKATSAKLKGEYRKIETN